MLSSLAWERGHVQAAHGDVAAASAIGIGDLVGAASRSYVDLSDHQVRLVVQNEPLDVLVGEHDFIVRVEVARERDKTQRREQGVLDRTEERRGRFGECGQDHPHTRMAAAHTGATASMWRGLLTR